MFSCTRKLDLCNYAVKEIQCEARNERERERLLKEIYALASQGDNAHVVRYHTAWEENDKLYIQMELCESSLAAKRDALGHAFDASTLQNVLAQVTRCQKLFYIHTHNISLKYEPASEPLHISETLYVRQIAAGLAHMHKTNVAHLDVKPENMYSTQRGVYKLGDLGLASLASSGIPPGVIERGTTTAEGAQGTPTQSHISPSILVYEEKSSNLFLFRSAAVNPESSCRNASSSSLLPLQVLEGP